MTLIHLFLEDYSSFDYENYPIFFQLTCVRVCVCVCIHAYVLIRGSFSVWPEVKKVT